MVKVGRCTEADCGRRRARIARRETREYREYLSGEQRREAGCSVRRMQTDFYHGLLSVAVSEGEGEADRGHGVTGRFQASEERP